MTYVRSEAMIKRETENLDARIEQGFDKIIDMYEAMMGGAQGPKLTAADRETLRAEIRHQMLSSG